MTKLKLGIALSGGGIRGIAHAGVLQALEENGIKPDIIGGTSCGSMIAVMYAMGYSPYHIYILFKRYANLIAKIKTKPILAGMYGCVFYRKAKISGLNDGKKIEKLYDYVANRRSISNINQIKMPIVIPTVDLMSGKECIFTNNIPSEELNKEIDEENNYVIDGMENIESIYDKVRNKKYYEKIYINDINVGKAIQASSSFPRFF